MLRKRVILHNNTPIKNENDNSNSYQQKISSWFDNRRGTVTSMLITTDKINETLIIWYVLLFPNRHYQADLAPPFAL